jgi:hypothetical protein
VKAYGGVDAYIHVFFTSEVVDGERSASQVLFFSKLYYDGKKNQER